MIIFLLILAVIATFVSMTLIPKPVVRYICTAISAIVVVGSVALLVMNDREHFGMKKITETTTQTVYSVSPSKQMPMLLYKNIGTDGKERVYVYKRMRTKENFPHRIGKTTNRVKTTNDDQARLEKKTTRWVYKMIPTAFGLESPGTTGKFPTGSTPSTCLRIGQPCQLPKPLNCKNWLNKTKLLWKRMLLST